MYAAVRTGAEGCEAGKDVSQATDVYIARQPVFDKRQRAIAYELLYRSGAENRYDGRDAYHSTAQVIVNAFMAIGIEHITGGSRALINFPEELLLSDYATVLPQEQVIIEVLETVEPTPEVIAACARLKQAGYQLALDDFVLLTADYLPLLEHTDLIKVDFRAASPSVLSVLPERLQPPASNCWPRRSRRSRSSSRPWSGATSSSRATSSAARRCSKAPTSPASKPTTCGSCRRSTARSWISASSRVSSRLSCRCPSNCSSTSTPRPSRGAARSARSSRHW